MDHTDAEAAKTLRGTDLTMRRWQEHGQVEGHQARDTAGRLFER
jgi:hypothetical protein